MGNRGILMDKLTYSQKKILINLKPKDRYYLRIIMQHGRIALTEAHRKGKVPYTTLASCMKRVAKKTGIDPYTFVGMVQISNAVIAGEKYLRERYPQGFPSDFDFNGVFTDVI